MDLAKRFKNNPILRPSDIKPSSKEMYIECLLNPGVFQFDGKIWMLCRVAERTKQVDGSIKVPVLDAKGKIEILTFHQNDPKLDDSDPRVIKYDGKFYLTTLSHLRLVCSDDGKKFTEPDSYKPINGEGVYESFGIEDCRITQINDGYHLTYTMVSEIAVGVGYMFTTDWKNFERRGMIFPPHNKDCAIFDTKINDKYFAFHRPSSPELGGNYIWIAESPDLLHWGNHQCVALTRPGMWDSARVGAGAAPIATSEGWLEIYHGADENNRYCLGALLLDKDNPSKVISRSIDPIMEPNMEYEKTGFFGNVIFTNGHIVNDDRITVYYGASDEVICGAELSIKEILKSLK
ncbi:MAG: glycoside hydrolase family 130 protein [Bacteroidales bacterium]|nr:glycoside hydrolase family 130 protein [Bacteroidales bacterium]MDD3891936.1 glycoside hydrolase family 130 protein [Bacteroidales bacterium]